MILVAAIPSHPAVARLAAFIAASDDAHLVVAERHRVAADSNGARTSIMATSPHVISGDAQPFAVLGGTGSRRRLGRS